jgi:mono/diheme cytochrome c family protein
MRRLKIIVLFAFALFGIAACYSSKPKGYVIADSKTYDASLFRQYCAVCHGPEAAGKITDDGKKVPSLREADFKFRTRDEIFKQISQGGNGMPPFKDQLTERELQMMTDFVYKDLRGGKRQ